MSLPEDAARRRFAAARVARLATASPDGRPHLVPIVFAVAGDVVYHGVDAKPKRHTTLRRLANLRANPQVSLLVDHYDDDWSRLWWVRVDGRAREVDPAAAEGAAALELLAARYPDFRLTGALIAIDVTTWSGWSAA
ncbi:TIGR03668 family PPOX class F420-dependent oxidoreductase [Dactylosporangium sp. NPDC005572]|uniref:TIGR03668 family PPOX class F420-dependent oxidoreductase n=1 Tax=Dactylosporangium sp. NPDC005572 TaxID=3156889 RepID=UPI0033BEBCD8